MKEMNDHAVNLVHNLTHSPKTNVFFILDESDIINLINASMPIYDSGDFLKLRQHLQSLEQMVLGSDKMALKMV